MKIVEGNIKEIKAELLEHGEVVVKFEDFQKFVNDEMPYFDCDFDIEVKGTTVKITMK